MDNGQQLEGVVRCTSCGSVYRRQRAGEVCVNCGAALSEPYAPVDLSREPRFLGVLGFLKPVADSVDSMLKSGNMLRAVGGLSLTERVEGAVMCGWCRRRYAARPESPNCASCGGVLPLAPGSDPGLPPASPPRRLPRQFFFNLFVKQNVGGIIGIVCVLISLPMLFVPFLGVPILLFGLLVGYSNFAMAYRRQVALSRGEPVLGRIESVQRIGEENAKGHGSVLYRVYFRFDANDEALLGMKYTYDPAVIQHFIGQPIWVVHLPRRPKYYAIWPPLA